MMNGDIESVPLLRTPSAQGTPSTLARGFSSASVHHGHDGPRSRRRPNFTDTPDGFDDASQHAATGSRRPMGYLASALARPALQELRRMATIDPAHGTLYRERAADVDEHFAMLGTQALARLACERTLDTLLFWRRWLTMLIHPATSMHDPRLDGGTGDDLVSHKVATRVHFFTRDHALLDGLLVGPQTGEPMPVLVLALGNCMFYESFAYVALQLAARHQLRVFLYNDRGIGRSLGRQCSTGQAVSDCRAALSTALKHSNGTLDVFGISLGGGKTAAALKQAQAANELTPQNVRTYINCHSFTSLTQCIGQLMGVWVGTLARALFALNGFDNLDALGAIKSRPLAQRTVVFTAEHDEVMRNGARLSAGLRGVETPNNVVFRDVPCQHNDFNDYFDPDGEHMQAWIEEVAAAADAGLNQ